MKDKEKNDAGPEITFDDRARIEPGTYLAYSRSAKVYRDGGFRRWTCMVTFDILDPDGVTVLAKVPLWLNLGMRERPHAGRRGRFFQEWVRANGAQPKRGDRMAPRIFTRRMARVEIADISGESSYSVVRQILSWETAGSFSQLINCQYQPSTSTIKEGTLEGAQLQTLTEKVWQKNDGAPISQKLRP